MNSGRCLDDMTNFSRFQLESSLLKFLLHISLAKEPEVSHLPRAAAIRLADSQPTQRCLTVANGLFMTVKDLNSFLF